MTITNCLGWCDTKDVQTQLLLIMLVHFHRNVQTENMILILQSLPLGHQADLFSCLQFALLIISKYKVLLLIGFANLVYIV